MEYDRVDLPLGDLPEDIVVGIGFHGNQETVLLDVSLQVLVYFEDLVNPLLNAKPVKTLEAKFHSEMHLKVAELDKV